MPNTNTYYGNSCPGYIMRRLNILKDTAKGFDCIIVGGGTSVNSIDFTELKRNYIKIILNNGQIPGVDFDYRFYFDSCVAKLLKKMDLGYEKLISYSNSKYPRVDYCYSLSEFEQFGYYVADWDNVGLKSLILIKKILNPDNIYLMGYDFYTKDGVSHFYGDEVGENKKYNMQSTLDDHKGKLSQYVERFEIVKDMQNVFNCNEQSKLKLFPYALPRELNLQSA